MSNFEVIALYIIVTTIAFVWAMISMAVESDKHHNKIMARLEDEFNAMEARDREKAREAARYGL